MKIPPIAQRLLPTIGLLVLVPLVGCSPGEANVIITVKDTATDAPVPGALLGIEAGGAYQPTPDPAKGNPSWQYGAQADGDGRVELVLPTGPYGFHSFAAGYFYGTVTMDVDSDPFELTVNTAPLGAEELPSLSDFTIVPATVAPGGSVEVSVNATAAAMDKPLSEEVIVVIPALSACAAMDPPSAGTPGVAYPDGIYRKTFSAPTTPGTYDVWVSVTTEACVTAPPMAMQLLVQ
jgi:hypothetical protein